jgi:hypothetical protein
MPWKALEDSGVSAVCSVAHDDLEQAAPQLFDTHRGKAGVYFHPSIIGGDGYQLRAQVSFCDLPSGSTHPNWKVLRDRYDVTKLPQTHSAPLRLWRKDTLRAYVPWAPAAELTWGVNDVAFIKFYEPGMVHFEYEGGAAVSIPLNALLPTAAEYLELVDKNIAGSKGTNVKTDRYRPKGEMQFSSQYLWPWWNAPHMGILAVPPPGSSVSDYQDPFLFKNVSGDSWYGYAAPLIHLLLARVERNRGLMRGHFFSEFKSTPRHWLETYTCSECNNDEMLIERTAAGGTGVNEDCRVRACPGKLLSSVNETYTCDVCAFARTDSISRNLEGAACVQPCAGVLQMVSSSPTLGWLGTLVGRNSTVYRCSVCARTSTVNEAASAAGTRAGTVCGVICNGHLRGAAATTTPQVIVGPLASLSLAALGSPLGSLWLMSGAGPRTFWAHEVGHHKHLEHAGDVIVVPAQHDHTSNTVEPALNLPPPNNTPANSAKWDRTCIMSYVNTESGPDKAYFCGKCILKLRGWKIEGSGAAAGDIIGDPASGLTGP